MLNDSYNGLTLDDAAGKAGGYVDYRQGGKRIVNYDFNAAISYCRKKGIEKADLTEDEWDMFEISTPL